MNETTGMIKNPILPGFNPDPSIVRVGDDFYIATSAFEWYPGMQIHHSRDLKHWRLAARPLNRAALLDTRGNPDSCGVWAQCLTWADGLFFLVYTDVKRFDGNFKDTHNYLTTCETIDGTWSDPVYLNSREGLIMDSKTGRFFSLFLQSMRSLALLCALLTAWIAPGCLAGEDTDRQRLFIIGQDLDSVRGYYASGCCPVADGKTAYLDFYNLLSEEAGYGGLGMDRDGNPLERDWDWGTGPANAWKSATESAGGFAIGLSITENHHPGGLARIAAGELDDNARQLARFIQLIERPVYLRIGYEFEGGWNHGYEDSDRYINVFRRIVDILREEGTENVEFVWQAATFPLDVLNDGGYTDYRNWYPGDDYVDWMGVSLFVGLDEVPAVKTAFVPPTGRELIGRMLDLAREKGKPVMIAEAAPQGFDLANGSNAHLTPGWDGESGKGRVERSPEQIWDAWFGPVFELMEENRDVIYALAYINCNWDAQAMWGPPYNSGYWGDTRLEASPYIARRFSQAIERWRSMD